MYVKSLRSFYYNGQWERKSMKLKLRRISKRRKKKKIGGITGRRPEVEIVKF